MFDLGLPVDMDQLGRTLEIMDQFVGIIRYSAYAKLNPENKPL